MNLSEEHLEKIEKEAKMFCQQNGIKYPKSFYPGTKIVVKHLIKFILSDPELLSKAGWVNLGDWVVGRGVRFTTIYTFKDEDGAEFETYEGVVEWNDTDMCIQIKTTAIDRDGINIIFKLSGSYWFGRVIDQNIEWISSPPQKK